MLELTKLIKKKALEIGFDLVGMTSAEPFERAYDIIKRRRLSEFIIDDPYLLTNPRCHLPSARSIISLAISYASSSEFKEDVHIALYARSMDYHQIMKEKLKLLMNFIEQFRPDAEMIAFTDTGPLLEREVANRAGIGWIGKNNNLINPIHGSFLVLGEILINIDLKIDQEMESRCGSCQLCLANCPGGALKKPYYLDPKKCISYLTQKKGFLNQLERKKIANNLWGCDACQLVCPYNQGIPTDLHLEFKPVLQGDAETVLNLSKNNLPLSWQNSALSWRGLRILKRNSLINIGNSKKKSYIPLIKKALNNPSPVLRAYAVWALGEIGAQSTEGDLKQLKEKEKDLNILAEINDALNKIRSRRGIDDPNKDC